MIERDGGREGVSSSVKSALKKREKGRHLDCSLMDISTC